MKRALFCTLVTTLFFVSSITTDLNGQEKGWGNLTGQILVDGKAPENPPENVGNNPDKAACLVDGKIPLDDGIVVSDKNELANVFVIMYTGRGANVPKKFHPSYDKMKDAKLTLDNVKCRFVPKALFARSGQTLILKNSDNVGHNCRIATMVHEHNVNIPKMDQVEIKLANGDDRIPGGVFCDIHKWMDSIIMVRDNPYVGISGADGKFTIENIPPGEWKFQFWHKKAGYLTTIEVGDFEVDKRRGYIEATIEDGKVLDLGVLKLPADALKSDDE